MAAIKNLPIMAPLADDVLKAAKAWRANTRVSPRDMTAAGDLVRAVDAVRGAEQTAASALQRAEIKALDELTRAREARRAAGETFFGPAPPAQQKQIRPDLAGAKRIHWTVAYRAEQMEAYLKARPELERS